MEIIIGFAATRKLESRGADWIWRIGYKESKQENLVKLYGALSGSEAPQPCLTTTLTKIAEVFEQSSSDEDEYVYTMTEEWQKVDKSFPEIGVDR